MRLLTAIILENEGLSLNHLSSLQRMALKRTYHGKLNVERTSKRGKEVLDSLIGMGLMDIAYGLTKDGLKAGALIDKFDGDKREDRRDSSQLAAADMEDQARDRGMKRRTHGTGEQFTEGELAAMRGAGLDASEISKLFEDDDEDDDEKKDCECDCDCDCDKSDKKDKKDDGDKEKESDDDDDDKEKESDDDDDDDDDDDEEVTESQKVKKECSVCKGQLLGVTLDQLTGKCYKCRSKDDDETE